MPKTLAPITLARGNHSSPKDGGCLLEWVSLFADEAWSDHPQSVSPVIAAFGRRWNDDLDDDGRQILLRFVPRPEKYGPVEPGGWGSGPLITGTNTGTADDERRAWIVTDWMVRTYLPAWLRLAKMDAQSDAVSSLPELADTPTWTAVSATVRGVRKDAYAARDAAGAAAGAAARDAAWAAAGAAARDAAWAAAWAAARDAAGAAAGAAARDAAGDAAWAAAWDAAGDAAWAAAGDTAGDAARDAAGAAAGAAARDAAWAAARDAARDAAGAAAGAAARDAARDAAGAAVRPTTLSLQASARDLLERLIAVGQPSA